MAKEQAGQPVLISAPKMRVVSFNIRGTAPYVQNAFSEKARTGLRTKQEAGSTSKKGQKREPKNFQAAHEGAKHTSTEGWNGIPASAFRAAMISACRLVGYKMTLGKLSVFIQQDGFDRVSFDPLVRITKGEPQYCEHYVRNETGVIDIRPRAMWREGWEADVRVEYDADQFTLTDIANLMHRVGRQIGIGEGRPDSKRSCGMGWGTFELVSDVADAAA